MAPPSSKTSPAADGAVPDTNPAPFAISAAAPIAGAWESFLQQGLRWAPVLDGSERLVGLLLRANLARAVLEDEPTVPLRPARARPQAPRPTTVRDVMTPVPCRTTAPTCPPPADP
jgi:CBS-domain-containing membrane protein